MKHDSAPVIALMDLDLPFPFRELESRFRDLSRYAEVTACEFLPGKEVNKIGDTAQNNDTRASGRIRKYCYSETRESVPFGRAGRRVFRYLTVPTMADTGPGIVFACELDFVLDGAAVAGTREFHLGLRKFLTKGKTTKGSLSSLS